MRLAPRAAVAFCLVSSPVFAQADTSRSRSTPRIAAWATVSAGLGFASERPALRLLGAQLGAFGSYGSWLAGYRRAGASGIESGGAYDDAVLVGHRFSGENATAFIALGPANVYDESTGTGTLGIGFTAEAGGNVRVLGLGVSTFGAFAPHRWYAGVGLTVDAGWIRGP